MWVEMERMIERVFRRNAAASRLKPLEKKGLWWVLPAFLLFSGLLSVIPDKEVYGAGEENRQFASKGDASPEIESSHGLKLPPLIQTTTLEEDYKAITGLGLAFTPLSQEEDLEQAFCNILCSCVRLQANGHYGSGSIYLMEADAIIIVSNRHLLEYWDEDSFVTFPGGIAQDGKVIGLSGKADVGFVRVSIDHFSWEELLALKNVRPRRESPENPTVTPGRGLLLVDMASDPDHPAMKRGEVILARTYLDDFGMEMLYGPGEALPGMSGSGVFDGYGNYLGMLTGATMGGEIAAVPAEVIDREYQMR